MKFAACLVLAMVFLLSRPDAHAEREITFAAYDMPSSGTVAIPVRKDAFSEGAFADVDAASGGALLRAIEAVSFHAEADQRSEERRVGRGCGVGSFGDSGHSRVCSSARTTAR